MPIFPRSNAGYNGYVIIAVPHLASNAARLQIPGASVTELNALLGDWAPAYSTAAAKITRTPVTIENRNDLRAELTRKLSAVYKDIPQSTLITDDRLVLRLKARDRVRTRARVMDHAPAVFPEAATHLVHKIRMSHPSTPESRQMPAGQHIVLLCFVGEAKLKPAEIIFNRQKMITRHISHLTFEEKDAGKTVYYQCCYENTRGERSPLSEMASAIIA